MPRRTTEPLEALEKRERRNKQFLVSDIVTPQFFLFKRRCVTRRLKCATLSARMVSVPPCTFTFDLKKTHQIVYCGTRINSVPTDTCSLCRRQQLSSESRFTNSSSSASHTDHLLTRHLAAAISSRFLHQFLRQQLVHKTEEINGELLCDNHQECATRM